MSRRDDLIPMFDPPTADPDLCPSRCLEDKRGQTAQGLPASHGRISVQVLSISVEIKVQK